MMYRDCNMVNLQIPLDIPDVEILKVENNEVGDLIITVKSTKVAQGNYPTH